MRLIKKGKSYFSAALLLLSVGAFAKTSIYRPNYKRMHPDAIKLMEKLAAGNYDLRTEIPGRMAKGQKGYAIITTKKKIKALKTFGDFVKQKRKRGFNVMVVTEDQWGGGVGLEAALNIKKWLVENHKKRRLLYVLMLGNPHPREGDVPFKKVSSSWRELKNIAAAGHIDKYMKSHPDFDAYDGYAPTDYFYVDLHSNWDKNNDGIYAGHDDWGEGGIDGQWDVLVGRIPYYGVDVPVGNAKEVDKILARTIRYENERGDLSWRHNIFYNGGMFSRDHYNFYGYGLRFNGGLMYRQTKDESGLPYVPEKTFGHVGAGTTADNLNTLNDGKWGYVHFQGMDFHLPEVVWIPILLNVSAINILKFIHVEPVMWHHLNTHVI